MPPRPRWIISCLKSTDGCKFTDESFGIDAPQYQLSGINLHRLPPLRVDRKLPFGLSLEKDAFIFQQDPEYIWSILRSTDSFTWFFQRIRCRSPERFTPKFKKYILHTIQEEMA